MREKKCASEREMERVGGSEKFSRAFFPTGIPRNDGRIETNNRMSLSMRYAQDKSPIRGASSTR